MLISILCGLSFVAVSVLISYKLSAFFWKTDYSKTDTSGDYGTPRGGILATLGGTLISMYLVAFLGKYVIDASIIGYVFIACMVTSVIAGFTPPIRAILRAFKK